MPKSERTLLIDGYQAKPRLTTGQRGYQATGKPASSSQTTTSPKLPNTPSAVQKPSK